MAARRHDQPLLLLVGIGGASTAFAKTTAGQIAVVRDGALSTTTASGR